MKLYRAGVVAVIQNSDGKLLFGQRSDMTSSWQFPQGGLEAGETPEDAFFRELREELGNGNCKILRKGTELVRYEWPRKGRDGMLGQEQTWFLGEFLEGEKPDLAQSDHCFSTWKWVSAEEALQLVVDWKRPAYEKGLRQILAPK